jgi:Zn-dependent protease/predicted transcriptional regulator
MKKNFSLYIGQYSGIKVFIHWTFWIILVWVFYIYYNIDQSPRDGLRGVLFILALFACVVLHEFGHALTAQRYHIKTRRITLYPIGGIASLERMPEKPKRELLVAAAGPLVNVVIAGILWIYLSSTGQMPDLQALENADQSELESINLPFFFSLMVANIILVVFNLIPAFPLDGGRMFRALLAFKMDRAKATRVAAGVGQFLAIALVFFGFFYNFWLVIIGFFIYLGAGSEANLESIRTGLGDHKVRDVLMGQFSRLAPGDSLEKAVEILLDGQEQEFIVAEDDNVVGVLTRKELIRALSEHGKSAPVSKAMSKEYLTLHPDMPLREVYQKMMTEGSTVSPVFEEGKFVGIVNKTNIDELLMVESAMKESSDDT